MNVCLGLDWSTRTVSVGLCCDGELIIRTLEVDRFNAPQALGLVLETLSDAGCSEKDITEIRIGRGPGNYTGIRQSIAFSIGLAAPSSLPVVAVNSGTLMQSDTLSESDARWIMGDARRGRWWGAHFPSMDPQWMVLPPEEWPKRVSQTPVMSAEPERLDTLEVQSATPSMSALLHVPADQLPEPVQPLYLHGPV